MKRIFWLLVIFVFCFNCLAASSNFIIDIGNKPSQLGFKVTEGDDPFYGPVSFTEYEDKIYILDEINLKVNLYTIKGEYKRSYKIQKGFEYHDIAVDSKGGIWLLSDRGIYLLNGNRLIKKYALPSYIDFPYSFQINNLGEIALNGLNKEGRIKSGFIGLDKKIKELNGYKVLMSKKGIYALQEDDSYISIINNAKLIKKVNLESGMIPVAISDTADLFCAKGLKDKIELYKISKNGKIIRRVIDYDTLLPGDEFSLVKYIRVNKSGQLLFLEANSKRGKVTVITF